MLNQIEYHIFQQSIIVKVDYSFHDWAYRPDLTCMLYAYLYSTSVLLCISMMHRESGYDSEVDPIVKYHISSSSSVLLDGLILDLLAQNESMDSI